MSHDAVLSLAAGVLPEHDGVVVAEAAVAAGYSHFGVTVGEQWTPAQTRAVRTVQQQHGLKCLDVEVIWLPPGGAISDLHRRIIAVAAELEAAHLLVVCDEPDLSRAASALRALCELAEPAGLRVCLEFLRITAISRPSQALAIVREAEHAAAGILVDSLHLARSGESAAVLAGQEALLPYLQLCDAPLDFEDNREALFVDALDRRTAPGEGELPLTQTLALNRAAPLSLEVRSLVYRERYPAPVERARAILEQTRRFLRAQAV